MRIMHIEDIWARSDNGEPELDQAEETESYIRHTRVRLSTPRYSKRPDGRRWDRRYRP